MSNPSSATQFLCAHPRPKIWCDDLSPRLRRPYGKGESMEEEEGISADYPAHVGRDKEEKGILWGKLWWVVWGMI